MPRKKAEESNEEVEKFYTQVMKSMGDSPHSLGNLKVRRYGTSDNLELDGDGVVSAEGILIFPGDFQKLADFFAYAARQVSKPKIKAEIVEEFYISPDVEIVDGNLDGN